MAIDRQSPTDFHQNELRQAVVHLLASDPGSPTAGQFWFNTTSHLLKYYDGTSTIVLGGLDKLTKAVADVDINSHKLTNVSDPTNPQDAATRAFVLALHVTDLTAPAADFSMNSHKITNVSDPTGAQDASTRGWTLGLRISDLTALNADYSVNSHKLTSVSDGTNANDAVNKGQLDAAIAGARDPKDSARVATATALPAYTRTSNVITATGNGALAAVDGVTLVANDRLLLKDGAAGADNGIYTVTTVGDGSNPYVLTRASDADASSEVTGGMYVWVNEGTANADTGWLLTTNDPITLNTTALTFTQVSALGQITAGAGLTKSGSTLNAGQGTGIVVNADDIAIDTTVVVRKYAADIGDNSTTSIVVTHGLGTRDVTVSVHDNTTPFGEVEVEVRKTSTTTITLVFSVAPTTNQYRVTVHG